MSTRTRIYAGFQQQLDHAYWTALFAWGTYGWKDRPTGSEGEKQ